MLCPTDECTGIGFYPVICARAAFSSGRSWEAHILVRSLKSVLRQTGTETLGVRVHRH